MFEFRIEPHPARGNVHGKLVPIITDVQMVKVKEGDGRWVQCAYCGTQPGRPLSFLKHEPEVFRNAVAAFVQDEVGPIASMAMPPQETHLDD